MLQVRRALISIRTYHLPDLASFNLIDIARHLCNLWQKFPIADFCNILSNTFIYPDATVILVTGH